MRRIVFMLLLGLISLSCLTACSKTDVIIEDTEEKTEGSTVPGVDVSAQDNSNVEGPSTPVEKEQETPARLNTAKYENLTEAAKQAGYSFRALKDFTSDEFHFNSFSISEPVEEVNGMELAQPCPVVKLLYKKGEVRLDVTIFPYEGEKIQSSFYNPICYISTEELNGIDVNLSEYIIHLVPEDYEMTEEDWEFLNSRKGSFSCDGTVRDVYNYSMYWVQDGIYYEIYGGTENASVEDIKALVVEFMNADVQ